MSDNQSLSNMSYVAWAQIVFYIGISIALIILRSKKTKYQKLTSKYTIEELVSKLNAKYSNLPPMGIVYGGKKRYNKHFFFSAKTGLVHLPKTWQGKMDIQSEFWTIYNYTNMIDARTAKLNYVTKAIWPNLIMISGLAAGALNITLTAILPMDFCHYVGSSESGMSIFIYTLFAVSVVFTVGAWIWWNLMFRKIINFVSELTIGVLDEEDRKRLLEIYKLFATVPLLINIVVRESGSPAKWDKENTPEVNELIRQSNQRLKEMKAEKKRNKRR
jgi:hypothetical protein